MIKRKCCRKIKKDYQAKNLKNPFFRKKEKEKKGQSFLGFKIFLFILILFAIIWFVFIFSFWNISNIEIKGTERIDQQSIKGLIEQQLDKKSFFIFKQDNIFLFRKKNITDVIKEEFNLTEIKIRKKLNNKLLIEVKEKPYSFIFCESGEYYFSSDDSYLMEHIIFEGSKEAVIEESGEAPLVVASEAELEDQTSEDMLDICVIGLDEKK